MAQTPVTAQPINGDLLEQVLLRARSDAAFRDRLLDAPEDTLASVHIRPDPKWVSFFKRLTADKFEADIQDKIENDPTGEGEGEGEGGE